MRRGLELSERATAEGPPFQPESLIALRQHGNPSTKARLGRMDEKLICLHRRRQTLPKP